MLLLNLFQGASIKLENSVNRMASPLRPQLGRIGRFLLIATFLEDAFRILVQWNEQVHFLHVYRHLPFALSHLFLLYNVFCMLIGSWLALFQKQVRLAGALLTSVLVVQTLGYGLIGQVAFMLRNVSLLGGLLVLLACSEKKKDKEKNQRYLSLPIMSEAERGTYLSLAGRVLLICLTVSLLYNHHQHQRQAAVSLIFRFSAILIAIAGSIMVAVGFKARHSAVLLVAVLSVLNFGLNNWWQYHPGSPERDFMRYDFFQTLSIIGGFLLLAHAGPGELSFDASVQKKAF